MLIRTNKGNEYEAIYAYAPTYDNALGIQITDDRKLSVIAQEFEGLQWVEAHALQPIKYKGYGELKLVSRAPDGTVQLKLYKE